MGRQEQDRGAAQAGQVPGAEAGPDCGPWGMWHRGGFVRCELVGLLVRH